MNGYGLLDCDQYKCINKYWERESNIIYYDNRFYYD